MKLFKKFSLVVLTLIMTVIVFADPMQIFAAENEYSNYGATYTVKEVVDEYDFGYGIKYHREISTLKPLQSGISASTTVGKEYGQQVNVLEITPSDEVELVPYAFLDGGQWHATSVKKAALQYEATHPGYRVVAAVNGDYFKISESVKASTGVTIGQGEYYKSISDHGGVNSIAIKNSGSGKQLFTTRVTATSPMLTIYDKDDNVIKKVVINKVNAEPGENEISLYYAQRQYPFSQYCNNEKASDVWFVKRGLYAVTSTTDSFYGVGNITDFVTGETEVALGQFAIKCNNSEINELLGKDVKIRVQYEYTDPSVEGIENFIGFPFTIIENGTIMNHDTNRHPRTIIGQKENGEVVLAVIDGRQTSKDMYGASSVEMAALMGYYGCVDAWNLDGGGSSTLIIRKQNDWVFNNTDNGFNDDNSNWYVTNSPSDGSERSDGNHLLVVVKLPDVKIDLTEAGENFIVINVALLSDLDKYSDLYVYMDKEYYQVQDGKVTISGLKKDTDYECYLYAKVNGNYVNLMINDTYSTSKAKPTSISVSVSLYEKNGVEQILFRYKVDKSEAVRTIVFIAGEERYLTASQTILLEKSQELLDLIKDGKIEISYKVNDRFDEEKLILEDYEITFDLMFIVEDMLYSTNSSFKDLFE